MPELPDVEVFKQYLDATSLYKTVENVEVKSSKILGKVSEQQLRTTLTGYKFQSTIRYGIYFFVSVEDNFWLTMHFGMTDSVKYFKSMNREPSHDRLLITFANGYHLAYNCQRKLGKVDLTENVEEFLKDKDLGPDVLDLDFETYEETLQGRRGTVKYTLMNQHILAGIGNIYSDETLFQTGIHPKTKANNLDGPALKNLFEKMKKVLKTAIDHRTNTEEFPEDFMIPHRFKRGRRPKCDSEMEQVKVSERTAYYCPECQKKIS